MSRSPGPPGRPSVASPLEARGELPAWGLVLLWLIALVIPACLLHLTVADRIQQEEAERELSVRKSLLAEMRNLESELDVDAAVRLSLQRLDHELGLVSGRPDQARRWQQMSGDGIASFQATLEARTGMKLFAHWLMKKFVARVS